MNRPPYLMQVKIKEPESRRINLWIPLFLIFPIIAIITLVIILILAPFVFLAAIVLWRFGWIKTLLLIVPLTIGCLWASRGLEVNVNSSKENVLISVK